MHTMCIKKLEPGTQFKISVHAKPNNKGHWGSKATLYITTQRDSPNASEDIGASNQIINDING